MKNGLSRRGFLKLGAGASALLAAPGVFVAATRRARADSHESVVTDTFLSGTLEDGLGKDYSPKTGQERQAIPSACWQCVARDGIVCFVEDGRLTHIEGNPKLPRTNGKICAKGQAGVNQVYDPDRLLFPMKRVGDRGSGNWKRITWTEALDEIGGVLKDLRDAGTPEKFMFHYGRMKASSSKMIKTYFLPAYGTGTIGNHTSICESNKWTAQELIWGKHYDINDVTRSKYILNFGSSPLDAHTSHIPLAQRLAGAIAKGTPLVTFDPRLSTTAARSTKWVPIQPGTDLAVVLAMTYHILNEDLAPQAGKDFVEMWSGVTLAEFTDFINNPKDNVPDDYKAEQPAGGYTPEWAEGVSGVSAATIKEVAEGYAAASPGSTIISYRGAVMHHNGVNVERAICALEGLCGNVDVEGGRAHAVGASWKYSSTYPKPSSSGVKKLSVTKGTAGYAFPSHGASHRVLETIAAAEPEGRPEVYMVYCYTPVYANGDMQRNIDILKDESIIKHYYNVNTSYDESAMYADILLPDATYLERWDWEDMVSYDQIHEYYIRQPAVGPLGEVRDFKDVLYDLATRIGDDIADVMSFKTAEEFVKAACNDTPGVAEAGGFEYMKEHGAWFDPDEEPSYLAYMAEVDPGDAHLDEETGVYWDAKPDEDTGEYPAYYWTSKSYKKYVGQKIGDKVYKGFKPDKINKSGLFEFKSPLLEDKGFPGWPAWWSVPEHANLGATDLIMTTFKLGTQIHSRSQNCKYVTELDHDNPAWIHPDTAAAVGVADGGEIKLTVKPIADGSGDAISSTKDSMTVKVKLTEAIKPGIIAISHHFGHWQYGRYASGAANPLIDDADQAAHAAGDADLDLKWWDATGYRSNWIMPNAGDPIAGGLRYFDTVVTATAV